MLHRPAETSIADRIGDSAFLVLAAAFLAACGSGEADTIPGRSQANPLDTEETAMVQSLNDLRAQEGAPPVRACTTLNVAASVHSDDMRDRHYSDSVGLDGSTPASRACDAGYQAACGMGASVAEAVAYGHFDASGTLGQWTQNPSTTATMTDAAHAAVGVGRSPSGDSAVWTLDLGGVDEASCD